MFAEMARKRGIAKWFDLLKTHRLDELNDDGMQMNSGYAVVDGTRYRSLVENHQAGYDEVDRSSEPQLKS